MIFDGKQREEFEKACKPLIKFLNDNCHPHITVVVDCIRAELSEGVCSVIIEDYLKD